MKCGYSKCRYGGIVEKEVAEKVGNRYYHKECLNEKNLKLQIEKYWQENFPQSTLVILRKAINNLIEKNGYDADYILYVMKWIKINNKIIRYPMGLVNYCNNVSLKDEYKNINIKKEYKKIKKDIKIEEVDDFKFNYSPKIGKFTDII